MKRAKDDEKVMGPMFPRLHVNDTEKGGPRAPPRNKMALYEQLSIPSQRFTRPGMMPNSNANFVQPASSSPGSEHELSTSFPVQVPPSRHYEEKPTSHYCDPNAPLEHLGQKLDSSEDDHEVPSFVGSEGVQDCGKYNNRMNRENMSPHNPTHSKYSIKSQGAVCEDLKQIGDMGVNVGQNVERQNVNTKDIVASRRLAETVSYSQSMDDARDLIKQAHMSFSHELRGASPNNFRRLQRPGSRLQPEQIIASQPGWKRGDRVNTQAIDRNHEIFSMPLGRFPSEEHTNIENVINDTESHEHRPCRSLQANNEDQEDDVSDTSMVDSVSGVDISPDDVVGIIGQKHFWKARRAIVNQQRVFAVQVFELHRLIKVQRLIAESPQLLEDSAYFEKPIKAAPVKKLPLEYIVKAPSSVSKQKSDKPNNQLECSAENTIGKASLSSVQNRSQPLNYGPSGGNTQSTPMVSDPNMGPWGFHQPQGHQWLVPVMSPTEGLVYKPYQGPGFTSPVCGGYGPPGSTPTMGNFLPPAYGVPASHHQYQGMGVQTFVPPVGPHGYFPPYGMPVMNQAMSARDAEQISQFTTDGLQRHLSGGRANFNVQHQKSPTLPSPKSRADRVAPKLNVPKDSELQFSTASSPTERAQDGLDSTTDGSNVLPLFPTSPIIEVRSGSPGHHEGDQTTRVIRVVPHNRRSATASAARIFRSIQEERKQYDSV